MNQTETIDYKHGTTYAITVTALMTCLLYTSGPALHLYHCHGAYAPACETDKYLIVNYLSVLFPFKYLAYRLKASQHHVIQADTGSQAY